MMNIDYANQTNQQQDTENFASQVWEFAIVIVSCAILSYALVGYLT